MTDRRRKFVMPRRSGMLRAAQLLTIAPLNPQEAAARQIAGLGYRI